MPILVQGSRVPELNVHVTSELGDRVPVVFVDEGVPDEAEKKNWEARDKAKAP